jgi:hypothetical protein
MNHRRRPTVLFVTMVLSVSLALSAQQRKRIELDELVIEGVLQKPEAFFILPRTNLNLADLERREDLKARIIQSIEETPFLPE